MKPHRSYCLKLDKHKERTPEFASYESYGSRNGTPQGPLTIHIEIEALANPSWDANTGESMGKLPADTVKQVGEWLKARVEDLVREALVATENKDGD